MNAWQWILICYLAADALATVAWVGKRIEVTPAIAVFTVLTHAGLVCAAVLA